MGLFKHTPKELQKVTGTNLIMASIFKKYSILTLLCIVLIVGLSVWYLEYYRLPTVSFTDIADNPVKLIGGIESYQSVNELKEYFTPKGLSWTVIENSPGPKSGRPPFNIVKTSVKAYKSYGISGELVLKFFNNRLMTTTFYPLEYDAYMEQLDRENHIKFGNVDEVNIAAYTNVMRGLDFKGRKYVVWVDVRLAEERSLWIKRYS